MKRRITHTVLQSLLVLIKGKSDKEHANGS